MENNNIQNFGENNVIEIGTGFDLNKVKITVKGNNNKICIKNTTVKQQGILSILVNAENSNITIDEDLFVGGMGLHVVCGNWAYKAVKNSSINIGKHFEVGGAQVIIYNSNAHINIGKNVMLAWGIMIYNTDAHPIYNSLNNKLSYKII